MKPIAAVVVASSTRSSDALINYTLGDKKEQQGERYVMSSGVHGLYVSRAKQQFRDVRKRYGKDRPGQYVQAYHVIQSFARDGVGALNPADPEEWTKAHELGRALAEKKAPGRQALVVTQRDGNTGCLHNHIVINSVSRDTGKSYDSSWITHSRLVRDHDTLLEEKGYVQRDDLRQASTDSLERFERGEVAVVRTSGERDSKAMRDYARWLDWESKRGIARENNLPFDDPEPFSEEVLASRIREALEDPSVTDWDSFVSSGQKHGVQIAQRGGKVRGISYGMVRRQADQLLEPMSAHKRRCASLGADFSMDAVEASWRDEPDSVTELLLSETKNEALVPTPVYSPKRRARKRPQRKNTTPPRRQSKKGTTQDELQGASPARFIVPVNLLGQPDMTSAQPASAVFRRVKPAHTGAIPKSKVPRALSAKDIVLAALERKLKTRGLGQEQENDDFELGG